MAAVGWSVHGYSPSRGWRWLRSPSFRSSSRRRPGSTQRLAATSRWMLKRVQHDGRWAEIFPAVIPAKAGIHKPVRVRQEPDGSGYMDSRLRGNDGLGSEGARAHVSRGLGQACVTGAVPLPCLPAAGTLHGDLGACGSGMPACNHPMRRHPVRGGRGISIGWPETGAWRFAPPASPGATHTMPTRSCGLGRRSPPRT